MQVKPLAPNKNRAQIAIGGLIGLIVSYLIFYGSSLGFVIWALRGATRWEIQPLVRFMFVFGWVHYGILVFVMVIFIMWFFRAYSNLKRLGKQLDNGLVLAIGGWFIPVANWIIVWRIYSEIVASYQVVIKGFSDYRTDKTPNERSQMVVGGWWWWSYVVLFVIHFWATLLLPTQGSWIVFVYSIFGLLHIVPAVLGILTLRKMILSEGTIYQIWRSGDYTARVEERQMARMEGVRGGASWYKTAEETDQQLGRSEDPFQ